ncbi:hypothetical protein RN001_004847 [Aquatica leii]|uniref:UPF3 domain-containing protein n=1 Tax=Aquatica leii TaxID=1421715 RepID=A0AAN7PC51_9COLE|nr:hypothetical protein RN001_004847 [Aquatica leii]
MAVSDVSNPTSDADKTLKELPKSKDKREKPFTKVVVRRLPPFIDQETFLVQVSPIPDYDYIYLVNGDTSLGENAFSRVYINFIQPSDIFAFKEKFDNYVFVDQKGHEYSAVVEFASFQKIPRKRKPRLDPKAGTIETDPLYLEFLESLKEQPNQDIKPEFSYQFNDTKDDVSSTPLLDYIKQRKIDKQRIREERREERKRKELERKKLREDERKKHDYKSSGKAVVKNSTSARSSKTSLDSVREESGDKSEIKVKGDDGKESGSLEKTPSTSTSKDEEKTYFKPKPRFPRPERVDYYDKRSDYKRRDEYREKEFRSRRFEEYRKEPDSKAPRKTKKYSEKREERRNEVKKAEQKNVEESAEKSESLNAFPEDSKSKCEIMEEKPEASNVEERKFESRSSTEMDEEISAFKEDSDNKYKNKENDPRLQRRIRNKDRPTMAIYQPGMLSKRRTSDDTEISPTPKE